MTVPAPHPPNAHPRRFLVPLDFSEASTAALRYAEIFAEKFDGSIDVLHVWEPPLYFGPDLLVYSPRVAAESLADLARKRAEAMVTEALAALIARGRVPVKHRVEIGSAPEKILAASVDYDLIIMGTNGRTGLGHVFLGSVAEKIVRRSSCPVLTIRAERSKDA